jgi:hypothetical protein
VGSDKRGMLSCMMAILIFVLGNLFQYFIQIESSVVIVMGSLTFMTIAGLVTIASDK